MEEERTDLVLKQDEIAALLEAMDGALAKANQVVSELETTNDEMAAMEYKDIKRYEAAANEAFLAADEARKAFGRNWDAPKRRVDAAFKAELEEIKELHETYRAERIRRDNAFKNERAAALADIYVDFCECNGVMKLAVNVPLERILESRWLNRSVSQEKARQEMLDKVAGILADWQSLLAVTYHYPDEAVRCFFRTLSLRDVNANDVRLWEEQQRAEALAAEVRENVNIQRGAQVPEAVPEVVPEPVQQPEQIAGIEEDPIFANMYEVFHWELSFDATEPQMERIISLMRDMDVHGSLKRSACNGR